MPGNLNIGSSVIKRESADYETVENKLMNDGWERTSTILNGKVAYFQKSGINITVVDGPMGTLIFPSGPVRGRLLGDEAVGVSQMSLIGLGGPSTDENVQTKGRGSELT